MTRRHGWQKAVYWFLVAMLCSLLFNGILAVH